MSRSYPQQGVEGTDGRYLRRDGSLGLTNPWFAGQFISADRLQATSGGNIILGDIANVLRIRNNAAEIIEVIGVSNNLAEMNQKNATMSDLAGVGVRNVKADVNGKLSAP